MAKKLHVAKIALGFMALIVFWCAFFALVAEAQAANYETREITLLWDYDPPPDLAKYHVWCTDRANDVVEVALDDVRLHGKDAGENGVDRWIWSGTVNVTAGKTECRVDAEDLAGQRSGWSEPGKKDFIPARVIHLTITSTDAVVIIKSDE